MIGITTIDQGRRYDVRLTGSIANLVVFGIVSFLRDRAIPRAIVGAFSLAGLLIGVILFLFGPYIFYRTTGLGVPLLTASFGLFVCVVLSSPKFNVYIGDPPEVEARREAEEQIGDTRDPYESLELDSKRLSEYYAINQSQARSSFRWAVFAMFCGLSTIIAGIWLFYFKAGVPNTFLTSLSTAAGIIINLISGLYLYLHNRTQRRSFFYYGQLVRVQMLGLAIRLAESHQDPGERTAGKNKVIDELLAITRLTAERDTVDAIKRVS